MAPRHSTPADLAGVLSRVHHPWYNYGMSSPIEHRPWPRHPGYLIGSDGTVIGPRGRSLVLITARGYLCFNAHVGAGTGHGRPTLVKVHVAVCETFHGPRPPGHHAAHDNGVKGDCSAENILWKTPAENGADACRHGAVAHKLTTDQVHEIRASGESAPALARRFGVHVRTVRDVRNGRTWKCVK